MVKIEWSKEIQKHWNIINKEANTIIDLLKKPFDQYQVIDVLLELNESMKELITNDTRTVYYCEDLEIIHE